MVRPGERWSEKDAKVAEGRHAVDGRAEGCSVRELKVSCSRVDANAVRVH